MGGRASKRQGGLRAALAAKRVNSVPHDLLVVDREQAQSAEEALDRARMADATARNLADRVKARGEDDSAARAVATEAAAALLAAQESRDACYERLTVSAIPPADFEALKASYPPSEQQREAGDRFDIEALRPALLAACVTDADGDHLTEEEWAAELASGRWGKGEMEEIELKAHSVNTRSPEWSSPKASDGTRSWPPAWLTAGPARSR